MTAHPTAQTRPAAEIMTGAEIVVRALVDQGVTDLFGYPGGAVLPIYDALSTSRGCVTSWCATSKARPTPPRATPAPPARSGWCW